MTLNANDTYIFNTYKLLQTIPLVLANKRHPVITGYETNNVKNRGKP